MSRFNQASSWVIAGFVFQFGLAVPGLWWLQENVLAPRCGDLAAAQLEAALEDIQGRIPSIDFAGIESACDSYFPLVSDGGVYAYWGAGDAAAVRQEAADAGCSVRNRGSADPDDTENDEYAESLTCRTGIWRTVVLSFTVDEEAPVGIFGEISFG